MKRDRHMGEPETKEMSPTEAHGRNKRVRYRYRLIRTIVCNQLNPKKKKTITKNKRGFEMTLT